jgi:hypothetical protein
MTMLAFDNIMCLYYCAGAGATGVVCVGVACVGVAGVVRAGVAGVSVCAGVSPPSIMLESAVVSVKLKLEAKIKIISAPANVQVLLSRKSVVFCTPPII